MAQYVSVGRIVIGEAGKDRREIAPGTQFDPAAEGLDEKEVDRLVAAGSLRKAPEEQPAPADGPREATAAATNQPAPGETATRESEVISREQPTDERA